MVAAASVCPSVCPSTNAALKALARRIGWLPVRTGKIMEGLQKVQDVQTIVETQGQSQLGESRRHFWLFYRPVQYLLFWLLIYL